MSKQTEALKLALEALEAAVSDDQPYIVRCKEAITALRERLAQPEQEPVAWMRHDGKRVTTAEDRKNYPDFETRYAVPLYTHPQAREPEQPAQQEPVAYIRDVIEGLNENGDPISVEAAELIAKLFPTTNRNANQ